MMRVIELSQSNQPGFRKAWGLTRLIAELDEGGTAQRELGYDKHGNLVHRFPGKQSLASHGVLDLALFDSSWSADLSAQDFEKLWSEPKP